MSASDFSVAIAKRIVQHRADRGWSQNELARRSQVAQPVISNAEAGKRELKAGDLRKIADAFGVLPSALLPGDAMTPLQLQAAELVGAPTYRAGRTLVDLGLRIMDAAHEADGDSE